MRTKAKTTPKRNTRSNGVSFGVEATFVLSGGRSTIRTYLCGSREEEAHGFVQDLRRMAKDLPDVSVGACVIALFGPVGAKQAIASAIKAAK